MSDQAKRTVLVIDDRDDLIEVCSRQLGDELRFVHARNAREADLPLRNPGEIALVLLDRDFSKADPSTLLGPPEEARYEGMHVLRWLKKSRPEIPVLMVTAYREQGAALAAADLWTDYLVWEDVAENPDLLPTRIRRILARGGEEEKKILRAFHEKGVVGRAPSFARALLALHGVLPSDKPILLIGETGTGKDLLALAFHLLSGDEGRPFVSLNVNALPGSMVEDELFGHVRGAYTGADQDRIGKLRMAHGGTLFLNEIADLRPEVQAKLLSAVEQKMVVPVGGDRALPADFRLVTASSQDLLSRVERGRFRKDLYHRLAWNSITIPPLRERREDIPLLVEHFLQEGGWGARPIGKVTQEAIRFLGSLPWVGNIRQLRAVVEAACLRADCAVTLLDVRSVVEEREARETAGEGVVVAGEAPLSAGAFSAPAAGPAEGEAEGRVFGRASHDEVTKKYYAHLVRITGGKMSEIARIAGISRATAYEWRRRYGAAE